MEPLDCAPLAGASPGAVLWSTLVDAGIYPASHLTVALGSTGRAFVAKSYRLPGGGAQPAGADVHELDGAGHHAGKVMSTSGHSQSDPFSSLLVHGARHWIVNTWYLSAGIGGSTTYQVWSDNGGASAQGPYNLPGQPYAILAGLGDAAGDLFIASYGHQMAGALERIDASGTTVYHDSMPASPVFTSATPDDAGNAYVSGSLQGTVDLGCGPVPGGGVHVTKLDPSGACVWSRGAGLSTNVAPIAAGASLSGTFSGTLDLGCGPMTSAGTSHYVALLDAAGACQWSRAFDVPSLAVSFFPSGDPLVSGAYTGVLDAGCGPMSSAAAKATFVARLDAAGACVWSRSFDVAAVGASIFPSSGDVVLSVANEGLVDLGGGPVGSGGPQDLSLTRLDGASGQHLWSKSFGAAGATVSGVAQAAVDGGTLVKGSVHGTVDFGGGPISTSGPPKACTTDFDCPNAVCNCPDITCSGGTCSPPLAVDFVLRLDANGGYRWQRTWVSAALDGCGATVVASWCKDCGPGGHVGVTVERVAP